jgi:hypothetical protein
MFEMTNERTEYVEKLMKFVIGEEVKVERTKGQKDKTPVLGTGHLADGKGATVKEGKREYASGNISKAEGRSMLDGRNYFKDAVEAKLGEWIKKHSTFMNEGNWLFQEIWNDMPFEGKGETEAERELGQLMDSMQKEYGFRDYY